MASKSVPAIKEPESRTTRIDVRAKSATALTTVNNETRMQAYVPGGELVGPSPRPESPDEGPTETTIRAYPHSQGTMPQAPRFFDWATFEEVSLPARENFKRSRRDKVFESLNELKLELPGEIGLEGLGGLGKSVHGIFHSSKYLDFLESKRDILLPEKPSSSSKSEAPSDRELQILETTLFDVTKFNDASNFLTAVTWSEEHDISGSITLYEVLADSSGNSIGIRPVAAMQHVPNPILVKLRTDEDVRKLVFVPAEGGQGRLKWRSNPQRGPTYVKLKNSERPAPSPSRSRDGRSPSRDSHGSHGSHSQKLADADAIQATIPQFVALLHASRSILEDVLSTHLELVKTKTGAVVPKIELTGPPRRNPHKGDKVHVAVLMPTDAEWADEHIYWTDSEDAAEFRHRRYWDLIEQERSKDDGGRSTSRHSHSHSRSRHDSRDGSRRSRSRSRSRSRHDSRSGRHLSLHNLLSK